MIGISHLSDDIRTHLQAEDYSFGDSELVFFKYNAQRQSLLFCINDLTEKIFQWLGRGPKTDYTFRYRFFLFNGVSDYLRTNVEWTQPPDHNDIYFPAPEDMPILVDGFHAKPHADPFRITLHFQRGFGSVDFNAACACVYQLCTYDQQRGKDLYVTTFDKEGHFKIDESDLLMSVFESDSFPPEGTYIE